MANEASNKNNAPLIMFNQGKDQFAELTKPSNSVVNRIFQWLKVKNIPYILTQKSLFVQINSDDKFN